MGLSVVRDLREMRAAACPEEIERFEIDVFAGFVLARCAAGLSDNTIRSDVSHLEQVRTWFGKPLWDMLPADADTYFGTVLRPVPIPTRLPVPHRPLPRRRTRATARVAAALHTDRARTDHGLPRPRPTPFGTGHTDRDADPGVVAHRTLLLMHPPPRDRHRRPLQRMPTPLPHRRLTFHLCCDPPVGGAAITGPPRCPHPLRTGPPRTPDRAETAGVRRSRITRNRQGHNPEPTACRSLPTKQPNTLPQRHHHPHQSQPISPHHPHHLPLHFFTPHAFRTSSIKQTSCIEDAFPDYRRKRDSVPVAQADYQELLPCRTLAPTPRLLMHQLSFSSTRSCHNFITTRGFV